MTETAWGRIPISGPGSSVDVKSGSSTSPYETEGEVTFTVAFGAAPTVVITPTDDVGVWITEITKSSFKWNNSAKAGEVTVHWIAFGVS